MRQKEDTDWRTELEDFSDASRQVYIWTELRDVNGHSVR